MKTLNNYADIEISLLNSENSYYSVDFRFIDPESARSYLESYFGTADIYLYWGSPQDFVKELSQRMAASI